MKVASRTDLGKKRQVNQDTYFVSKEPVGALPNLFFVCDGMGGQKAGGYASERAKELIIDYIKKQGTVESIPYSITQALNIANLDLYNKQLNDSDYEGMGTTFVGGVIFYDQLYIGNVGDSRCYQIRSEIKQISHDHSLVQELLDCGAIEKGSKAYKEQSHIITRAIGAERRLLSEFKETDLMVGDYVLFCSDGLHSMLNDNEIFEIVTSNLKIEDKVNKLVDEANNKGGKDNITVILIEIESVERREANEKG